MKDDSIILFEKSECSETESSICEKYDCPNSDSGVIKPVGVGNIAEDEPSNSKDVIPNISIASNHINQNIDEYSGLGSNDGESEDNIDNFNIDENNYDSVSILSDVTDINLLSVEKLKVVEHQNTELICENEDQRKVIEMLRVELTRKDEELIIVESKVNEWEKKFMDLQTSTDKQISDLKKSYELANKDKESMVIKYAMGEKDIMIARRGKEDLDRKMKESVKDKDSLLYKIKTLSTERTRLQGICDVRGQETMAAKREADKWKEEVKVIEGKMNLTSNRLKVEADAHRETKHSLDTTFKQLCEVQGSIDDIRSECDQVVSQHKADEENLKKKEVIKEKEHSVKLMIDSVAAAELESLRSKHKALLEENNELSLKVQRNEKDLLAYESSLSEAKDTVNRQKTEIVDLYAKCAELESVKLQLEKEKERCSARDCEVERLRMESVEVQSDMASCRRKEAELLEFTQKLTEKNVCLQSEFSSIEARASVLEEEHARLSSALARSESQLGDVTAQLEMETSKRREETEMLARKLAEKTRSCDSHSQSSVDSKAELEVVKRKNQQRLRELTKELSSTKKKLDQLEREQSSSAVNPGLSPGSRCSSSSSLNKQLTEQELSPPGRVATVGLAVPPTVTNGRKVSSEQQSGERDQGRVRQMSGSSTSSSCAPDTQQLLVEKIVKLQRACARRQEKLDFLEEHVQQLLTELKKKNRLIQAYFMNLETGALVSEESDIHKALVVATGSGIMASLYNSKVADTGMTLELSLEINKKLQTVLEDTLLKNITLKENINTLGDEISKISMSRHRNGS